MHPTAQLGFSVKGPRNVGEEGHASGGEGFYG